MTDLEVYVVTAKEKAQVRGENEAEKVCEKVVGVHRGR